MRDARIQTRAWHHDAEAVGADDAHQVRLGSIQQRLLQLATAPLHALPNAGTDDHGGPRSPRCQLGDDAWHQVRRCADHREVGRHREASDVRIGEHALDDAALRVDRHHRTVEPAGEQVASEQRAQGRGGRAGPHQSDRLRPEQELQIAHGHARLSTTEAHPSGPHGCVTRRTEACSRMPSRAIMMAASASPGNWAPCAAGRERVG